MPKPVHSGIERLEIAMPWNAEIDTLDRGRVVRARIHRDGSPAPYAQVIEGWRCDARFREVFAEVLADAPFRAYFWETPPVARDTVTRPFEFVLVDGPALAGMPPDPDAFARYFAAAGPEADVATFDNLGRDAVLVAPTPRASADSYPHIAVFSRTAPKARQHAFWQAVGQAMTSRLGDQPLWLSTSGLGVAWLHARLDTRPKYYTFDPYRRYPSP